MGGCDGPCEGTRTNSTGCHPLFFLRTAQSLDDENSKHKSKRPLTFHKYYPKIDNFVSKEFPFSLSVCSSISRRHLLLGVFFEWITTMTGRIVWL